jgi:multidrug efflux pump subunit AcrB
MAWLERNRVAMLFGVGLLMIAGVRAFVLMPKDVFPNAAFPRIRIVADIGFSSLDNTEINVTRPLEEALKTVADVREVRSVTERGTSTLDIYLRWGTDLLLAMQAVQAKVDQARAGLPAGVSIEITRMTTSAFPMSEYGIWSETLDLKQLSSLVKYKAIPRLIGVEGVAGLELVGGEQPEVWVKLDPRKLIQYNLDATALESALDSANRISFLGTVNRGPQALFVVGGRRLSDASALKGVVVASRMGRAILLSDVAELSDAHAQVRRIVSVDGHKGLLIDVRKQPAADALKVSAALEAKMDEVAASFGGGLHLSRWDLSDFVRRSIRGILTDILAALAIILAIVMLILRRMRYALPIILVMPVVLVIEFLVMRLLGQTVNIMTLGGLSAAIGIIADNAIVLTENHVHVRQASGARDSLVASMQSIVPITVWATLVTIVVFLPLSLLSGVPGLFFGPLAATLASTIVLSLLVAVLVLPLFLKHFVEDEPRQAGKAQEEGQNGPFQRLEAIYARILDWALQRRKTLAWGLAALMLASGLLFARLPSGFLPEWDEGDIVMDSIQPSGTSLAEADRVSQQMEAVVAKIPELRMSIRKTGTSLGEAYIPPNVGELIMLLNPERRRSTQEVMDSLRESLAKELPEVDIDLHQMLPDRLGDLTGEAKPIVVSLSGAAGPELWDAAQALRASLEKVPGLDGVTVDLPPPQLELKVTPDERRLSLLGLNADSAFHYSQLALYGEEATAIQHESQSTPVRVFYAGDYLANPQSIPSIPVYTNNGGVQPLGRLATYKEESSFPEVHHRNGALAIDVIAEITERSLSAVVRDIQKVLADTKRPGITYELAGNYRNQQTSFHELLQVLGLSLVLILAALLFVFDSWRTAMAVFLGTLASGSFVVVGIALSRIEFDVSSFTGLIAVMGVVVNNGILVLEFAVRNGRLPGMAPREAVRQACMLRFRPVLITNLAAIAGFLPMALNLGQGGEVLRPFSIAMISGLVGSMAFSLLVMPSLYLMLLRDKATVAPTQGRPRMRGRATGARP